MNQEVEEKRRRRAEWAPPYSLLLRGEGRRALVIGGGTVAARKVEGLLRSGITVTVLSPELCSELEELAAGFPVEVLRGRYPEDARGGLAIFDLVFAATNIREINRAIGERCHLEKILVNIADDPESGDFINPAVIPFDESGVVVTVSTGGKSPGLAKKVREAVQRALREDLSEDGPGRVNPN